MLRGIWSLLVVVGSAVALGTVATVTSLARPGSAATLRMGRVWSRWVLASAGIRVEYEGTDLGSRVEPCIFMPNHQSNADIWALAPALPDSTTFVAKRSLFRVPFVGWSMRAAGFIPLDRDQRDRAIESLCLAVRRLRNGRSLVLFPEGTRSRDGRLQPFKKGVFHVALDSGVPIVPVAIVGTRALLPPGSLLLRPGRVRVRFADAVDTVAFRKDDVAGLMGAVRGSIVRLLTDETGSPGAPNRDIAAR